VNPIYWLLTIVWYLTHAAVIESVFPWPVLYVGTAGLFLGNAVFTLSLISGCFARGNFEDVKWALLAPLYWVLMSGGPAWKALIQLCYKPQYWGRRCTASVRSRITWSPSPSQPALRPLQLSRTDERLQVAGAGGELAPWCLDGDGGERTGGELFLQRFGGV